MDGSLTFTTRAPEDAVARVVFRALPATHHAFASSSGIRGGPPDTGTYTACGPAWALSGLRSRLASLFPDVRFK